MTEFYKQPKLPSKTKRVRLNEEKLLALKHGARKPVKGRGKKIKPIEGEIWKPALGKNNEEIKGYFVSNIGRVKKLCSFVTGETIEMELNGRTLPSAQGKTIDRLGSVARLVAKAFIPTENSDQLKVLHKDFDKTNCHADNLFFGTLREAFNHKKKSGQANAYIKTQNIIDPKTGETKTRKVAYSDADVQEIRRLRKLGYTQAKIAELVKCSQAYISLATNNKGFRKFKNEGKPTDENKS